MYIHVVQLHLLCQNFEFLNHGEPIYSNRFPLGIRTAVPITAAQFDHGDIRSRPTGWHGHCINNIFAHVFNVGHTSVHQDGVHDKRFISILDTDIGCNEPRVIIMLHPESHCVGDQSR